LNCLTCQKETKNPKFCSQSCAARLNNNLFPKRVKSLRQEKVATTLETHKCKYPLCSNLTHRAFCSRNCNTKYNVTEWRRRTKLRAIEYKGGQCIRCGYSKSPAALEFHHRDPAQKEFGIAGAGNCVAWEKLRSELDKCDLLCANCHREVEAS
jgi:hypothetical protein